MLYLLTGPNKHYKQYLVSQIRKEHTDFSFYVFDCSETAKVTKNYVDGIVNQTSLFDAPSQILYFKEYTKFDDIDYIYSLLTKLGEHEDTIIILDASEKLRANAKVLKFVTNKKNQIAAEEYSHTQLLNMVKKLLYDAKFDNTGILAERLIQIVDNNPFYLENEIQKLSLLRDSTPITLDSLTDLVSKSLHYSIWEYIASLTKGDRASALSSVVDLLDKGESEYGIIGMIIWNLRLVMSVKAADRMSDYAIASEMGYSPYSIKQVRSMLSRFSFGKITLLYEKVIELDYRIKSGLIEPRLGIILLSFVF
jgi:DNA polymerase III delta subunit